MKSMVASLLIGCFFASTAVAKSVNFDLKLKITSGNITSQSSGNISAKLGSPFHMARNNTKFEVTAIEDELEMGPNALLLRAKVYAMNSGKLKLVAEPQILTVRGQKSTITTKDINGKQVELEIRAL